MKDQKGSFILTMRCAVLKSVVVVDCTEDEARRDPWRYAVEEREISMEDWEVTRVESNE